jgi:hypothetical protein
MDDIEEEEEEEEEEDYIWLLSISLHFVGQYIAS